MEWKGVANPMLGLLLFLVREEGEGKRNKCKFTILFDVTKPTRL